MFDQETLEKEWRFEDEIVKTKVLFPKAKRNMEYDESTFCPPHDIDSEFFPAVKRGRPMVSATEAKQLLEDLKGLPDLTKPALTPEVWEVSKNIF